MSIKEKAKELLKDIPVVYLCLKSKETPILAKILCAITVFYALSPIDLIPDFIPVLGYLDDIIILPALIAIIIKMIPKELFAQKKIEAENMWKDGKPKKWYYAIPIIVFWLIIILVILKSIFWKTK